MINAHFPAKHVDGRGKPFYHNNSLKLITNEGLHEGSKDFKPVNMIGIVFSKISANLR